MSEPSQIESAIRELVRGVGPQDYRVVDHLEHHLGRPGRPVPFVGRQAKLRKLDTWMSSDASTPYMLVAAEMGRGKSALLARWVSLHIDLGAVDVAYLPVNFAVGTHVAEVALSALCQRLGHLLDDGIRPPSQPTLSDWLDLLADVIRRPRDRPLLIVIDGLDEALGWRIDRSVFGRMPAPNVRAVISVRLQGDDTVETWRHRLGWGSEDLAVVEYLPPLSPAEVRDALIAFGLPEVSWDTVEAFHARTAGEPLVCKLYFKALLERQGRKLDAPFDVLGVDPGIASWFAQWWSTQQERWRAAGQDPLAERAVSATLDILASARGPVEQGDVVAIAAEGGVELDGLTFEHVTAAVRDFVRVHRHDRTEVSFAHFALNEFFAGRLDAAARRKWRSAILAVGRRQVEAGLRGQTAELSRYFVVHYAAHLVEANAAPEDHAPLVSVEWLDACRKATDSPGFYLRDVRTAFQRTRESTPGCIDYRMRVDMVCRAALLAASVASSATNLSAPVVTALLERGLWTIDKSLAHARHVADPWERARLLIHIARRQPTREQGRTVEEAIAALDANTQPTQRWDDRVALLKILAEQHFGAQFLALTRVLLAEIGADPSLSVAAELLTQLGSLGAQLDEKTCVKLLNSCATLTPLLRVFVMIGCRPPCKPSDETFADGIPGLATVLSEVQRRRVVDDATALLDDVVANPEYGASYTWRVLARLVELGRADAAGPLGVRLQATCSEARLRVGEEERLSFADTLARGGHGDLAVELVLAAGRDHEFGRLVARISEHLDDDRLRSLIARIGIRPGQWGRAAALGPICTELVRRGHVDEALRVLDDTVNPHDLAAANVDVWLARALARAGHEQAAVERLPEGVARFNALTGVIPHLSLARLLELRPQLDTTDRRWAIQAAFFTARDAFVARLTEIADVDLALKQLRALAVDRSTLSKLGPRADDALVRQILANEVPGFDTRACLSLEISCYRELLRRGRPIDQPAHLDPFLGGIRFERCLAALTARSNLDVFETMREAARVCTTAFAGVSLVDALGRIRSTCRDEAELRTFVAEAQTIPIRLLVPPAESLRQIREHSELPENVRLVRDLVLRDASNACIENSSWQLALDTARMILSTDLRSECLVALACKRTCPDDLCLSAVREIRRVADTAIRIRTVLGLTTQLGTDAFAEQVDGILADPPSEEREIGVLLSHVDFITQVETATVVEAEVTLRRMLESITLVWTHDSEPARLRSQLNERLLDVVEVPRAFGLIDKLAMESERKRALLRFLPLCPEAALAEAESRIRSLRLTSDRAELRMAVLTCWPSRQALLDVLAEFGHHLDPDIRLQLVQDLAALPRPPDGDDELTARITEVLTPSEHLTVALGWVLRSGSREHVEVLSALTNRCDTDGLAQLLTAEGLALTVRDRATIAGAIECQHRKSTWLEHTQRRVLASAHLSEADREIALPRILEAVRMIDQPRVRASTMLEFAGSFPPPMRRRAFEEALWLIDHLDPHEDRPTLYLRASELARDIDASPPDRPGDALGFLGPARHLNQVTLIQTALAAADDSPTGLRRPWFVALANAVAEPLRTCCLAHALDAWFREGCPLDACTALFADLPPELVWFGFCRVRDSDDPQHAALLAHIIPIAAATADGERLAELLCVASTLAHREGLLVELSRLSAERGHAAQALEAALLVRDPEQRSFALSVFSRNVEVEDRWSSFLLWSSVFQDLDRPRPEVLSDIRATAPWIARLGGLEVVMDVTKSITNVCQDFE